MNRVVLIPLMLATLTLAGCTEDPLTEEEYNDWGLDMTEEAAAQMRRGADATVSWQEGQTSEERALLVISDAESEMGKLHDEALGVTPPDRISGYIHGLAVEALDKFTESLSKIVLCIETYDNRHCSEGDRLSEVGVELIEEWENEVGSAGLPGF